MRTRLTTSRALCEQSDDDDSAFLKWDHFRHYFTTDPSAIFESLVARIRDGHPFNDSLEKKAVLFLDRIRPSGSSEAEVFIRSLTHSSSNKSLTDFVTSITVLLSSSRPTIINSSMCMLDRLICRCSPPFRLKLIEAQLIPQIIISLNPQSLLLREAVCIHTNLLRLIASSHDLITSEGLALLAIEPHHDQQKVLETVHSQVLVPSKSFILHLCEHRYSIENRLTLYDFTRVLVQLLRISPYYQLTMDFVLDMPAILTITSFLTFLENEYELDCIFANILRTWKKWNEEAENIHRSGTILIRSLRMEGLEDVSEQRLKTHKKNTNNRQYVALEEILPRRNVSTMLGTNIGRHY